MAGKLSKRSTTLMVLWLLAFVSALMTLIPLKDTLLSCDDSISNFIYARITDSSFSLKKTFEYSLMRGKIGILFPILITARDYMYRNGNYALYWSMQYIPVYANVLLASYFISKKLSKEAAPLFVVLFSALLQVNGWHSLITCYPMEFMYGLFMALLGVILFDTYINGEESADGSTEVSANVGVKGSVKGSVKGRKKSWILMALSVICYYASMQTYEAFLLFAAFYGFLSFYSKDKWASRIKALIPHMVTAMIYVGIFIYLNLFPVVESNGYDITKRGSFGGFILTDLIFAFGMFPLTNIIFPSILKGISFNKITLISVIGAVSAAVATAVYLVVFMKEGINRKKYVHAGIIGASMALIFPMMHSMTSKYQMWALKEHQFGYVPSTISYFGWALFSMMFVLVVFDKVVTAKKNLRKPLIVVISILIFMSALLTSMINNTIKDKSIGPSSPKLSYRAQSMYALATSDEFSALNSELLYAPDYEGVHGMFMDNEFIIQYETGNDVLIKVTNDKSLYESLFDSSNNPLVYRYFYGADVGILLVMASPTEVSSFYIVSSHGFNGSVVYVSDGGENRQHYSLERGEVMYVDNVESFDFDTLAVTTGNRL